MKKIIYKKVFNYLLTMRIYDKDNKYKYTITPNKFIQNLNNGNAWENWFFLNIIIDSSPAINRL